VYCPLPLYLQTMGTGAPGPRDRGPEPRAEHSRRSSAEALFIHDFMMWFLNTGTHFST
jgi:hypothetical protein